MNESTIISVLETLNCRKIQSRGNNVNSTCPNEGDHNNGVDRSPSFGVEINPSGFSKFQCYACSLKGIFEYYAKQRGIDVETGIFIDNPKDYFYKPKYGYNLFEKKNSELCFLSENSLGSFIGAVPQYFLDRGFEIRVAKAWELGYDRKYQRLTFTVRDRKNRLLGVLGRTINDHKAKYINYNYDTVNHCLVPWIDYDRHDDFIRFPKSAVLYGEHMIDFSGIAENRRYIVVCEGPTDTLKLWQYGFVSVSVLGSSISDFQLSTLLDLLPNGYGIMIGSDSDKAGNKLKNQLLRNLAGKVPLYVPEFPEGKDPADLTKDQVLSIFSSAEPVVKAPKK